MEEFEATLTHMVSLNRLALTCALSWPRGYITFSMLNSTLKFFLLINVKMQTIVGILTFMSGKNSILGLSEPRNSQIS